MEAELLQKSAEFGYLLASPCALCEGKDEQLKEVSKALNEMTGDWLQKGRRITELEKECEGKEKEIAELKAEN